MLCQLDNWNLKNSNCVPMTMSEVNATGMLYFVFRSVLRGLTGPHAHFSGCVRYQRGQTLYSSHTRAISGPQLSASRCESLRFLFCSFK